MAAWDTIKRLLGIDRSSAYFAEYVQRTNAVLASHAGVAVALLQLVLFVNVLLHMDSPDLMADRMNRAHAISYLVFAAVSLALAFVARRALKRNEVHAIVTPITAYIVIAAAYGIFNSYIDALYGEPPLTFIFCMVASTCVFVIPPLGSINITSLAFIIFSVLVNTSAIFAPNTVFHYWTGWVIVTFVSILRYQECRYGASHEQQLRDASEVDDLTGLNNRRSLRSDFLDFVGRDVFVTMCDVDDFKGVNDSYGHVVGDRVLIAFAQAIRSQFPDDACYRYGGDEALLIAWSCSSKEDFLARMDRVRATFARLVEHSCGIKNPPSMSSGYSHGRAESGEDLRAMVHVADTNLYLVKNGQKGGISGEAFSAGTR